MEKRKRRHKRRLLLLVLALLFTSALFTTSTYAWFTANQQVSIQRLKVNVEAQNGLQISADGTNWKSVVQTQDFKTVRAAGGTYAGAHNQFPETLEPVSTIGALNADNEMKMYYGQVVSNPTTGVNYLTSELQEDGSTDTGKYIAFDMFLKVDTGKTIYMTTNSGVRVYNPDNLENPTDKGVKNAARMGFVVMGHIASGSGVDEIQNIGKNQGDSPASYIWELNNNMHTASAVGHARDVYNISVNEGTTGNTAVAYTGLKDEFDYDQDDMSANVVLNTTSGTQYATDYSDYFGVVTPTYSTVQNFSEDFSFLTLSSGITKIRVYMWIEGQDVDCENAASGEDVTFDIQLTTIHV